MGWRATTVRTIEAGACTLIGATLGFFLWRQPERWYPGWQYDAAVSHVGFILFGAVLAAAAYWLIDAWWRDRQRDT
jgi:hypothetical protein